MNTGEPGASNVLGRSSVAQPPAPQAHTLPRIEMESELQPQEVTHAAVRMSLTEARAAVARVLLRAQHVDNGIWKMKARKGSPVSPTSSRIMSVLQTTSENAFLGYNNGVTVKPPACLSGQAEPYLGSGQVGARSWGVWMLGGGGTCPWVRVVSRRTSLPGHRPVG